MRSFSASRRSCFTALSGDSLMLLRFRGVTVGHSRPYCTLCSGLETSQYLRFQLTYKKRKEKKEWVGEKKNPDAEQEQCFGFVLKGLSSLN